MDGQSRRFAKGGSLISFERHWNNNETGGNGDWSIAGGFTNLDAPPPVVDAKQCAEIAEQIESLKENLAEDIDINERNRILRTIGELKRRSVRIGCSQL
jgi:hypothetical protein